MSQAEPNPGKHQTIIFDRDVTNIGGHYNHHAGIFISPDDAVYTFTWTIHCYRDDDSFVSTELVINSNPVGASSCHGGVGFLGHTSGNVVVEVNQGDVVYVRTHPSKNIFGRIEGSTIGNCFNQNK
jgi:hypothetical protein